MITSEQTKARLQRRKAQQQAAHHIISQPCRQPSASSTPIVTCRRSARASSSSSPASSSSVHKGSIRPTAGLVHAYPAPRDSTLHGLSPLAHAKKPYAGQYVLRTLQQYQQPDCFGLLADCGFRKPPAAGMDCMTDCSCSFARTRAASTYMIHSGMLQHISTLAGNRRETN
ncbi:hypothetical protein M440DRAFT_195948 [Trichoderma longibrachiatum ATCC 18648]|uniref:Uncharacterized protein n=1 Tax=Trichoderma longibrachiatum ATCC 18648 TaxID=983965 RepID=A0A2T4CG19_TRILO|nr:hypothetical protein M440DRAFT_195948 [Trichoderma longibrachiatum ATCC 18648]